MKNLIVICIMLTLITASGCWTRSSDKGGTAAVDESFSISVPSSVTVKQGEEAIITVTLKRAAFFKRDVQLDIKAVDISLTPARILVKASDKPDVQVKVAAAKNAAIGEYRVTVTGTPTTGLPASTVCNVRVVSP
ncbi:MAG: hypothetical protein WC637_04815 [Victivallales bacterium]